MPKVISQEIKDKIIEYAKQGLSAYKISTLVNCSDSTILNIFKQNKISIKKQGFQPIYPIEHHFFSNLENENSAYYAGLLAADGWLTKRNVIGITLTKEDKNILLNLSIILSPNKALHIVERDITTDSIKDRVFTRRASCLLSWTSKQMTSDLNVIGITNNKSLTMGGIASNVPEVSRHHFIRGYLDGDGYVVNCILKRNNRRYLKVGFCGTKEFLEDLKICINTALQIHVGCVYKTSNSPIYCLEYTGIRTSLLIKDYLYNNANIFMQRKLNKYTF